MYDFQFPEGATRWDDPIPGVEGNGGWWMDTPTHRVIKEKTIHV